MYVKTPTTRAEREHYGRTYQFAELAAAAGAQFASQDQSGEHGQNAECDDGSLGKQHGSCVWVCVCVLFGKAWQGGGETNCEHFSGPVLGAVRSKEESKLLQVSPLTSWTMDSD